MSRAKILRVFVEAKRVADFIASHLCQAGFPTTSIHGDRLQREREEALADFTYGKTSTLIATSVASRGLDIKGVASVVNYDLPKAIDDCVHRIGRTGRVGNTGSAIGFYDSALAADLVKILAGAEQEVPDFLQRDAGSADFGGAAGGSYASRDIRRGASLAVRRRRRWHGRRGGRLQPAAGHHGRGGLGLAPGTA
ncbi:ATP-dependent RNA helicase vasa-like [Pollicipes pollicipes]|uniref:ATP-dependent RNA helicase vasa-like n=1 Tax=Pollicipes pollicipes TaxID=41117 RepID=UPI0018855B9B|nr:ATP-dependent RNA helicase vasa-like [Pollicipes pollicipes]XP_037089632.1 ATP-dependent RNA helicase vasa-like [Pollicipes pollicipes]